MSLFDVIDEVRSTYFILWSSFIPKSKLQNNWKCIHQATRDLSFRNQRWSQRVATVSEGHLGGKCLAQILAHVVLSSNMMLLIRTLNLLSMNNFWRTLKTWSFPWDNWSLSMLTRSKAVMPSSQSSPLRPTVMLAKRTLLCLKPRKVVKLLPRIVTPSPTCILSKFPMTNSKPPRSNPLPTKIVAVVKPPRN